MCGAYIAGNPGLGYKYIFWISAALIGVTWLLQIFLVPETSFDRQAELEREQHADTGEKTFGEEKNGVETAETVERSLQPGEAYMSFASSRKIGVYNGHVVKHFLDPWRTLVFPGLWLVMLLYSGLLGGLVTLSTIGPQILAMPPYLWGNKVGLLALAGFVGVVLGGLTSFITGDVFMTRAARKNAHGLAEPESRLPAMCLALFIATTGL